MALDCHKKMSSFCEPTVSVMKDLNDTGIRAHTATICPQSIPIASTCKLFGKSQRNKLGVSNLVKIIKVLSKCWKGQNKIPTKL